MKRLVSTIMMFAVPMWMSIQLQAAQLERTSTTLGTDRNKPATPVVSDKPAAPPAESSNPAGGGAATQPPSGGATVAPPSIHPDIAGKPMPRQYCYFDEICVVAVKFINLGGPVGANVPIPFPSWARNGTAITAGDVKHGRKAPGWPTQAEHQWTANFLFSAAQLSQGDYELTATLPRLATEKETANNVSRAPVRIGYSDAAVKLVRKYVNASTKYEIWVEVENKGQLPTNYILVKAAAVQTNAAAAKACAEQAQGPGQGCLSGYRYFLEPLAPGNKKRFKLGPAYFITEKFFAYTYLYCVKVDGQGVCGEPPGDNNSDSRTFEHDELKPI